MNCKEFADFLLDYIEGTLPADQAAAFEEHLQLCPPCIHYLDSYRHCVELGRNCICKDDEIPCDVPERLIEAILAARKQF